MTPLIFLAGLFILGLMMGSFLSVVIHRLHFGKSGIFLGNSTCPHCNKRLGPQDLIPLVSYLWNKGKCRQCKKPISWHYPVLELSTAVLFVAMAVLGLSPLPLYLFYGLVLIFIFFYDLLYLEIPDEVMLPSIAVAIIGSFFIGTEVFFSGFLGAAVIVGFFLLQILLSQGRWLGGGDLRIGAFMGFVLGLKLTLVALFMTYLIGSVISVALLMTGKVTRKSMIAFGPFLVLGTLVALFYGNTLLEAYLNMTQLG